MLEVIDKQTGEYPDVEKIALEEDWAKHLIYCDIDGFAIDEYGALVLTDDCGNSAICPHDRFEVSIYNLTPARVKELAEAELEGRLVVLPTDMFNTCYAVLPINCEYHDCPIQDDDGNCEPVKNGTMPFKCPHQIYELQPFKHTFEDLHGIKLFATREEAEKALEVIK